MPFSDTAPCDRWPILVALLSAAILWVYVLEQDDAERARLLADFALRPDAFHAAWERFASRPASLLEEPLAVLRDVARPLLGASALSAGPIHAVASALFLFVFGDNVEGRLGRVRFVLLWVAGAALAGFVHARLYPAQSLPVVGASGAIAAVIGAYAVLFRKARMRFARYFEFPCLLAIAAFFAVQIRPVQMAFGWVGVLDVLEWRAHLASFALGLLAAPLLCVANPRKQPGGDQRVRDSS